MVGNISYMRSLIERHPGWISVVCSVFVLSLALSTCWPMLHAAGHNSVSQPALSSMDKGDLATHHHTTTESTTKLCCFTQVGLNDHEEMPLAVYTGSDLRASSPDATLVALLAPSLGDVRFADARNWTLSASVPSPIYLTTLRLRI